MYFNSISFDKRLKAETKLKSVANLNETFSLVDIDLQTVYTRRKNLARGIDYCNIINYITLDVTDGCENIKYLLLIILALLWNKRIRQDISRIISCFLVTSVFGH